MPRNGGSRGTHHATKQKGKSRRGHGLSTYSRMEKAKKADRYDRPYLEGTYTKGA